ncbi:hypothetical protein HO173_005939 [Letharia columbiana]|uniref:Uncharacterized protein n=1 Tax=Letharia columbiana TaxID=112416 RepID=A0A8H6L4W7_9LECA|nr:uncharacterized protein HO173_005939 [Letharia columbiana]KAF6235744.1 hypothetical protein HO173_005939 [Letharia columbiana]
MFRWTVSAKTPLECNELQSILAIDPVFQLSKSTNVDCASSTKTCAAPSSRQKSLHLPALNINAHANGLVPRAHSAKTHASILHDPKPRAVQSPQLFRSRRNVHGMRAGHGGRDYAAVSGCGDAVRTAARGGNS